MSMPVPGMKLRTVWHGDATPLTSMTSPVEEGRRHGSMVPFGPIMTKSPGAAGQPSTADLRYSVQNLWFALSLRLAITDQMVAIIAYPLGSSGQSFGGGTGFFADSDGRD